MKSRYFLWGVAVLAIAVLIAWIARNTYWEEVEVPMPMQGEALSNSLYAAERFVAALGATAHPQRNLGALPDPDSIIYLSYWNWDMFPARRERLQEWVASGGRLVADRTLIGGARALEDWTGMSREWVLDEDDLAEDPGIADEDCAALEAEGDARASYMVCGLETLTRLVSSRQPSWVLSDDRGIQALRLPIGRGSFTYLNAQPFDNVRLFRGDNGLLFVSATGLESGDHVYLLSEEETPSLLALMWKHGAPVVVLLLGALALALWRGSPRFGPSAAVADPARRSLAEQIVGTGLFTLRFGGGRALHAAAVRALHEVAEHRLSGYRSSSSEDRIALLASSAGVDEELLREAINHSGPRRPRELRKAIALLETTRRRIP